LGLSVPAGAATAALAATLVFGALGVASSMLIYIVTRRAFWKALRTVPSFVLTCAWLGPAALLLFNCVYAAETQAQRVIGMKTLCACVALAALLKMGLEAFVFRHLRKRAPVHPLKKSALLMARDLVVPTNMRYLCGVIGGVLLPLLTMGPNAVMSVNVIFAAAIFSFSLLSELLERVLFFKAVVALKMPGGTAA
jgi:DMSO reductase anchor subunit